MRPWSSIVVLSGLLFLAQAIQPLRAFAEGIKTYTLKESIAEAFANNWALKATAEKVDQAVFVKNQARAEFLPKLSTSYGYARLNEAPTIKSLYNLQIGTEDNYQWESKVTQPLFTGFALLSSYRLAQLGIDESEMELEKKKLDLALEVKRAYFGILTVDAGVGAAEKAVEALDSHANVARSHYKVGMIPINDLLQSEVELGNAQHDEIKVRNNARLARSRFNTVLSRPVNAPVNVKDVPIHKIQKPSFQEYVQDALRNLPEIKLIDISLQQVDQAKTMAKSNYYPEVVFEWSYTREGDTPSVSGSLYHDESAWQAMAGLSWTFWEWGKTYYSVKEQESLKSELLKTKMELEKIIELQIKDAVLSLETAEANIPITKKAVEQGEENLRVSQERYKAQVSTSTEVLDAQRYLTRARVNHFTSLYEYHLAVAKLLRAVGAY